MLFRDKSTSILFEECARLFVAFQTQNSSKCDTPYDVSRHCGQKSDIEDDSSFITTKVSENHISSEHERSPMKFFGSVS